MEEMRCADIHRALSSLTAGEGPVEMGHDLVLLLNREGLVSAMPSWAYEEFMAESAALGQEGAGAGKGAVDLAGYLPTRDGDHVKLLDDAYGLMERIGLRLPRAADMTLSELDADISALRGRIDSLCGRYLHFRERLVGLEWSEGSSYTNDYALFTALLEERFPGEDCPERMRAVNQHLHELKWLESERITAVATAAALPGSMESITEALSETYIHLVEKRNFAKSLFTWWDAAAVMRLGSSPEENVGRFTETLDALQPRGTHYNTTCFIAAHLCLADGSPEEIVRSYRETRQALPGGDSAKFSDTDIAALILQDCAGPVEERAGRFSEVIAAMGRQGWDSTARWYPTAAMLSLLPGTPDENVWWATRIYHVFKDKGFSWPETSKAASLLLTAYGDRVTTRVTPTVVPIARDFEPPPEPIS